MDDAESIAILRTRFHKVDRLLADWNLISVANGGKKKIENIAQEIGH
jgi:hypothetical protein